MKIDKSEIKLKADPARVISRYFRVSTSGRVETIIDRIMKLPDSDVDEQLKNVLGMFEHRHKNFNDLLLGNFGRTEEILDRQINLTGNRKLLIGSYFTNEYSIQSAALFNPSIVPHFDQNDTTKGGLKFILSLRATGEGHISSVEFREGNISSEGNISLIDRSNYAVAASHDKSKRYSLEFIKSGLSEPSNSELALLNKLPDFFTVEELNSYRAQDQEYSNIDKLIDANYNCTFSNEYSISERVLFPISKTESVGMEDARFVLFNDIEETIYYATYTAYDGHRIQTQLITTNDFQNFDISSLHGSSVKDKGFALFPRKINGRYCITSRQDGENMFLMYSDNIHLWENSEIIRVPEEPWEFVQLGNCGSPIETSEGWLLLTHAVGPMRRYVISAVMLDLDNPSKVVGRLKTPLLEPDEVEREGYVPNVVYSCGSIVHNNNLIIPYAMADSACGFAKIKLDELLNEMR